jgi:hypothetical protein
MKDKVIEAAGKTWRFLGQNGEVSVSKLPKELKENEPLVFQALGWLAREDKINYSIKNRRTFVSLVDSEVQAFNSLMYNMNNEIQNSAPAAVKRPAKRKK